MWVYAYTVFWRNGAKKSFHVLLWIRLCSFNRRTRRVGASLLYDELTLPLPLVTHLWSWGSPWRPVLVSRTHTAWSTVLSSVLKLMGEVHARLTRLSHCNSPLPSLSSPLHVFCMASVLPMLPSPGSSACVLTPGRRNHFAYYNYHTHEGNAMLHTTF